MIKIINLEYTLIISWIGILISINSHYASTLQLQNESNIFFSKSNIFILLNFIRFYIPFILFPILIIIFFTTPIKKPNILIFAFAAFWFLQLFSFFISDRHKESLESFPETYFIGSTIVNEYKEAFMNNLNLIFCSLSILIIISIAKNINLEKFNKKVLIITICFIGVIAIYFSLNLINELIENNLKFAYSTSTLAPMGTTAEQPNPRITGISRMILILYFLFFCLLNNNYNKLIYYIILIILGLLIYIMQSRGSFVGIAILYFIYFLFYNLNLQKKLLVFFILIIIPVSFYELSFQIMSKDSIEKLQSNQIVTTPKNRIFLSSTSGRVVIWERALTIIKDKKMLLGYGPQSDRFLLNQLKKNESIEEYLSLKYGINYLFDSNVSNSLLYAYLCSGLAGFILFLFIYLLVIKNLTKKIFISKIFTSNDILNNFSVILLIYLGFRGLFENSFSVFGVDYILFILSYIILENSDNLPSKV